MPIEIKKAASVGNYKLKFDFNNGKTKIVDFGNFLQKAINPMTSQFLNKKKFNSFQIINGDIIWGDYEMCFPIWDLYKGKI